MGKPRNWPVHRERDLRLLSGRDHAPRFLESRRHRLFGQDVCAMVRRSLGDFSVTGVFRAYDDDVELLGAQHRAIVFVAARRPGRCERALEIGGAASLDPRPRRGPRLGVGAGYDAGAAAGDEAVHELVHVHMRETDHANPVRLRIRSVHGDYPLNPLPAMTCGRDKPNRWRVALAMR